MTRTAPRLRMRRRLARLASVAAVTGLLAAGCAAGDTTEAPSDTASGEAGSLPVEMHVRWVIDGEFPATMTIHEPPADQDLYEVRTYGRGDTADVGAPIADGVLRAPYGEPRRFIALLRNDSDEDVRFWVAPHLPIPHISHEGLMMFCLCTGEVYEVPAGGTWTRVMEFGVTRRAGLEGPVSLTHVIVRGDLVQPTPISRTGGAG